MPVVTSKIDPTNGGRLRKRANIDFRRRLLSARNDSIALFKAIPRKKTTQQVITNDTEVIWEYDLSGEEILLLLAGIESILDEQLETATGIPLEDWWFANYDEISWRAGALSENNNINQLAGAIAAVTLLSTQQVVTRTDYIDELFNEILASFNSIKGLSDKTSQQVFQVIVSGMQGGQSPTQIRKAITKRFDVAASGAKRIVDTEINRVNNNARTLITQIYRDDFGINAAVLHISALLPTTRSHHAARHGRVFTPEQQNSWWSEGANRINCHCSVRTVLLQDDDTPVDSKFLKTMKKQRKEFFDM